MADSVSGMETTTPSVKPRKLLLENRLSPGDILVMTAAIRCLHEQYPGQFQVGVRSACPGIFEHSPDVVQLEEDDPEVEKIEMKYPLIDESNQRPVHFMQGYVDYLGDQLGLPLRLTTRRPHLWISEQERKWQP